MNVTEASYRIRRPLNSAFKNPNRCLNMSLENNTETKDKDSEASSPTPQANQDQTGLKDVEDQPTSTPPSSPRNMEPWAWILLITSVLSSIFLFALDNTIVADVQPRVVKELGEIDKLPWISVAFAACGVSTNLMWYVL